MKKLIMALIIFLCFATVIQAQIYIDVDVAVVLAVNKHPIQSDAGVIDEGVTYDEAGMDLVWHFTPPAGPTTSTDVTLTTGDDQDWAHTKGGVYTCEIPISGETINNTLEGSGYFTGNCTADLPWSSYVYIFRHANKNDLEIEDGTAQTNQDNFFDGTGLSVATFTTDAITQANIETYSQTGAAAAITADAEIETIKDNVALILADTDDIGVAGAGLTESGGTGDQLTAINLPNQTMTITGDITGNLSGSVGSVTAGVDVVSFNTVNTQMEMLMDVTTTVAADDDLEAVVVVGSVLAHVMGSGADVSTFDASTDALDNPSATVDEILDELLSPDHLTWGTVGWALNLIRAIR